MWTFLKYKIDGESDRKRLYKSQVNQAIYSSISSAESLARHTMTDVYREENRGLIKTAKNED